MRFRNEIPLELQAADILGSANDDTPTLDAPDAFDKFVDTCALAASTGLGRTAHQHIENFRAETANLNKRVAETYRARAAAALRKAAQSEWSEEIGTAGGRLEKRYSGVSGYREWFENGIRLGKTASEMVESWCAENPRHSAEVEQELRRVASEF